MTTAIAMPEAATRTTCGSCDHPFHMGVCGHFGCRCTTGAPPPADIEPRVLIVSRSPGRLVELTLLVQGEGYLTAMAGTYDDAIDRWRDIRPAAVVFDVLGVRPSDGDTRPGDFHAWLRAQRAQRHFGVAYLYTRQSRRFLKSTLLGPVVQKPVLPDVFSDVLHSIVGPRVISGADWYLDMRLGALRGPNGLFIHLTDIESRLLGFMASRVGELFATETLLSRVWGYEYPVAASTLVRAHISNLRGKLRHVDADQYLVTVRGRGYVFVARADIDGDVS